MVSSYQESRKASSFVQSASTGLPVATIAIGLVIFLSLVLITIHVQTVEVKSVEHLSVLKHQVAATVVRGTRPLLLSVLPSSACRINSGCFLFSAIKFSYNMKFLLLNAQSFATARYNLSSLVLDYDIDILCLNETWENINSATPISLPNYRCYSRPRPTDPHGGVAIFIKQNGNTFVVDKCNKYNHQDLELLALTVKTNSDVVFDLIVAYIPPGKTEQMKLLSDQVSLNADGNIILMGDFNAKSKEWNDPVCNESGDILEDLMTKCDLIIHNDGQQTRRNNNTVIDLILTSASLSHLVSSCCTLTHEKVRSDHIPIYLDSSFDSKDVVSHTKSIKQIKKVDWTKWKSVNEDKFQGWLKNKTGEFDKDMESFYNVLNSSVQELIPEREVKVSKLKPRPCWWNENVKLANKNLNHWQRKFKNRNTIQNRDALLEAEIQLEKAKNEAMESWSNSLIDSFEKAHDPSERWSVFKQMTRKATDNSILPLIDSNGNIAFDSAEKCTVLQNVFFDPQSNSSLAFDNDFKSEVELKVLDLCGSQDMENADDLGFNTDIKDSELDGAIFRLKLGKSPGPDSIYPEMLCHSGDYFREAILYIFNLSWRTGKLPDVWSHASVKFLRKHNKSDFYSPSSYRPISLTSVLCKLMERIVMKRLESHVEGNQLLDPQQEGFRKYHSTTYAVTRLVQSVVNGFNDNKYSLACFVDLAKAFDSVWREGLMFKLSNIGVCGRLWMWLKSFLDNRTARCYIGDTVGNQFCSDIGLPQGSVTAPLLFSIYILDMFSGISGDHCKFADDGTLWHSGVQVQQLEDKVCKDVSILKAWCRKWRMNISLPKTEITLFSKKSDTLYQPKIKIDDQILQYNKTPKLLGIYLDEKLSFKKHIEVVAQKASKCLGMLREIKGIAKVSSKNLIQLYTSLVRPVIEYGGMIWQVASSDDLRALRVVQRKSLALCLNAPASSSREALEVAAGIPPLDLRLTEMSIREIAKINAKSIEHPLKLQLNQCMGQEPGRKFIGPLDLALSQAAEMQQYTNISISMIQPEPAYNPGDLVRTLKHPKYWSQLGSSKSRSTEQQEKGKGIIQQLLLEAPARSSIAFTDGSCLGNPGPCGAGAVIYLPDEQSGIELTRPVAARGSILLAELVAVLLVLESVTSKRIWELSSCLQIFSDSQSAVGILTLNWASENYTDIIFKIKSFLQQLKTKGFDVIIHWTPGHATIEGNEIADRLAKDAAQQASDMPLETSIVT
ncbi:MAG: reverse transcriptase domain-containing protein, partial [Candidatus Thiodiazotropha sp.]